jgi:hypothetical protein
VTRGDEASPVSTLALVDAIAVATAAAATELFGEFPGHHFYYFALVTTGEAHAPNVTAWSIEALDEAAAKLQTDPHARADLKWSYADSPFHCYGERHFSEVRRLFDALPELDPHDDAAWRHRYDFRMSVMEEALARLEREGLFGTGPARARIVVNVECMPPDHTNVERALRLNPAEALTYWLKEAASAG